MSGLKSRNKGKIGEREWAEQCNAHGFTARRTQQYSGNNGTDDVTVEELSHLIHWEVKRAEKLNINEAYSQALSDAPSHKIPIVAHRKNHGTWMCTLSGAALLSLLKILVTISGIESIEVKGWKSEK